MSEPELIRLSDTVLLGSSTDLAEFRLRVSEDAELVGASSLHYETFSLAFPDRESAVLSFDVTRGSRFGPVGERINQSVRLEGRMTGALSLDGQTITWNDVEGTATMTVPLEEATSVPLMAIDATSEPSGPAGVAIVLGTWTRTAVPAPEPDADTDGVSDEFDQCADTLAGATVDTKGCAASERDADADLVTDDRDQCENTPLNEDVDDNGCALIQFDGDADGINDANDECPDSPPETPVDVTGCPVDPPGPITQSWNADATEFLDNLDSTVSMVFGLTAEGTLNQAHVTIEDESSEAPPGSTLTILLDTVPFRVRTDIASRRFGDGDTSFGTTAYGVRFDRFTVTFEADQTVTWDFDMTRTTIGSVVGVPVDRRQRFVGTMIGSLADDGNKITWTSVTGTEMDASGFPPLGEGAVDPVPLEWRFLESDLGSWTRIE